MLIGIFYSQIVERSSLVSVLFREAISHPYISLFHLLVNGFSVIYIRTDPITFPARLRVRVKSTETRDELQIPAIQNKSYVNITLYYIPTSLPQEQAAKTNIVSEVRI